MMAWSDQDRADQARRKKPNQRRYVMPKASVRNLQIEYETFGESSNPALLLIIGLGGQLIEWPEAICKKFAANGYYVIRFDNRDSGLSSKLDDAGIPDISEIFNALLSGKPAKPPYTLEDMADDAVGLLDALNIQKAHICGMSMGGMIAQAVAIKHASRVLSLISIYSTTGNPELPPPTPEAMATLTVPVATQREAYIAQSVKTFRVTAGTGLPFDELFHKKIAAESYDRSFYPQGVARQLAAIMTQPNRKPQLSAVKAPTLVVHGDEDPLVPLAAGKDTAEAIQGSQLLVIKGMGHELPMMNDYWQKITNAMIDHMGKTD
jgi:pimeloyl-ACP methyl ester carboxylesterase